MHQLLLLKQVVYLQLCDKYFIITCCSLLYIARIKTNLPIGNTHIYPSIKIYVFMMLKRDIL